MATSEEQETRTAAEPGDAGEPVDSGESKAPRSSASRGRRAPRSKKSQASPPQDASDPHAVDRQHVLEALEVGLTEALPGTEILDRDLRFDGDVRADLAAVDPTGRLVLVLVAGEDGAGSVLEALDVLAYARANVTLLMRHLASRRLDPASEPRVVVIDPSNDDAVAARLGSLGASGVDLFGVRTLSSAAGERSYLMAMGADQESAAGPTGVQAFLDALPLPLREVGRELAERMSRLDDDLFATADRSALVWRWRGEVMARMQWEGDHLVASVAPDYRPATLREPPDVEEVVEGALACLVAGLDPRVEPADELPRPTGPVGGILSSDEPILTPEEIDAFRD